jgi:hypothetical protein
LLRQLEQELPNIRLALDWAYNDPGSVEDRLEKGLRLCTALAFFWAPRCRHMEGIRGLERFLQLQQQRGNGMPLSPAICQARAKRCGHWISYVNILANQSIVLLTEPFVRQLSEAGSTG